MPFLLNRLMRKLYSLLILLMPLSALAQVFGNEWIDYSQKYYRFPITQKGLYKIDHATLVSAGINPTLFTSTEIQVFGREKEIPLHLVDNGDNSFDPGDYFVFVANGNDGWLDSVIVTDASKLANPNVSLINDTINYYFTWKSGGTGKRYTVDSDTDYSSYTPISYVVKEVSSNYKNTYYEGALLDKASGSLYAPGEGYGYLEGVAVNGDYVNWLSISTPDKYTGNDCPLPVIHVRVSSNSSSESTTPYNHHLRLSSPSASTVFFDSIWSNYVQIRTTQTLPHSAVQNGVSYLSFEIPDDIGSVVDRQAVTYCTFSYSRNTSSNGLSLDMFSVLNHPSEIKSRIDLANFNSVNAIALYSTGIPRIQFGTYNGGNQQFLIPNNASGSKTDVEVYDFNNPISIASLTAVNGNGTFTDYTSLLVDSALIMVTHPSLDSAASNYKAYRESAAGGSHNTIYVFSDELAEQFGGGIPMHPAGIRRFAHFVYSNTSQKPAGLFILGKGIAAPEHRFDPSNYALVQVPCFGYPASDIALTAGLGNTILEPLVPTGRISVSTNNEIQSYLNKVITYESAQQISSATFEQELDWQKQVLHFVGGATASQQVTYQTWMNGMKNILEDSLYAANVTNYFKTSSDPLDPAVVSGVTDKIANGVSLMTFFGHAAASNNGFEINIDDPANWDNNGKYPIVIGNSCYNGNIYTNGYSTSDHFVNIPDLGAIAFISSVSVGYDSYLADYTRELYRHFSNKNYSKPIGYQIQQTIKSIQGSGTNIMLESTCTQMALNGDPMIRLNGQQKPEVSIHTSDLAFSPANVTLDVDSIALTFKVKNLGASITDSVFIEIKRNFPGSTIDSIYTFFIPKLNYDTTLTYKFPLQPEISGGINQFTVSVDIPSNYTEQFEEITNNTTSANFFIAISGINPIWPYNYAVVPYDTVTVKASTINPIASIKTYRFQLDTTDTYDSPMFRQFSVTGLGGVKEVPHTAWLSSSGSPMPLVCTDSTVYFWRVAVDSSVLNWSEFSFQYIPGKRGWGQDHFFQFKNNSFSSIDYNRTNRSRDFITGQQHQLYIRAYDNNSVYNQWGMDNSLIDYATVMCNQPGLYVGVLDPVTLEPWYTHHDSENPDHDFGNANNDGGYCARDRAEGFFAFDQSDPAQLAAFENMITNEVPDGHYIAIYTATATQYHYWDLYQPSLYGTLQSMGSNIVSDPAEKPFAMILKKGAPSSLVEKFYPDTISSTTGPHIFLEFFFNEVDYIGVEKTPLIGPAFEWQTMYWKRDSLELVQADSVRLRIETFDFEQALQTTIDTVFTPNDSILNLNGLVDASVYPYIRLNILNADATYFTPAQIDRLHVLYSPVPEAAIDGTIGYFLNPNNDTLFEGEQIRFAVDVKNISDYDMDSLLVNYWIEDANHVQHAIPYNRKPPLLSGNVLRDTITFSTLDLAGYNGLWMEVNPYVNGSLVRTDQLEQYHFNNILNIPFIVEGDDEHPILDVTFDGRHILNGDIISPESEILITLKDENPYLIMDDISDTALFGVYLTDPFGNQKRIPFFDGQGNTVMQWFPAEAQQKKFKILYPTEFLQDGTYSLFVQGTDKSGNISGDFEYRVKFEVIRESSITYLMNYPNPFSTSTRFVFTLTGTDEPDDVLIQIMTVSGRVIREINEQELGKIHIGRNISEFAWDGTDEFGDPLANGIYLYRVKAKINGEDIKHRETGADEYFKEEFGKMYLLR